MCINIPDLPSSNLLWYLPRATSFIESALDNGGIVLIHCVHGQSRSCAVCVAYLMRKSIQCGNVSAGSVNDTIDQISAGMKSMGKGEGGNVHQCKSGAKTTKINNNLASIGHISGVELLHECCEFVQNSRPSMAINPGFVRQLEMFRRMGCGLDKQQHDCKGESGNCNLKTPPKSRSYAAFRAFRSKTEYGERCSVSKFFPTSILSSSSSDSTKVNRCKKCRVSLFSGDNIVSKWTESDNIALPVCDYWKDSAGGKEFASLMSSRINGQNTSKSKLFAGELKNACLKTSFMQVEPIDWMKIQMRSGIEKEDEYLQPNGKLMCPGCNTKLGNWDWHHSDPYNAIFIQTSKVD
mmetsp:Transcript_21579/g.28695  ORF Transcript_21579/g.28695 Transcript_21579/m.28695 type:complete len:351 (+) Transcript_21579:180-1232(+)